jgi:molybdate transport system substrate-binding protein
MRPFVWAAAAAGLLLSQAAPASAADITLLCSNALKSVIDELHPQFEKASGHKLHIIYNATGPLKAQIEKGQPFDVAIFGVGAIDELIKQGKLAGRTDIARSALGVAIRKGARKPDIATTAGFKQMLTNAKSVAYNEVGLTGAYMKGLLRRLDLVEALKGKTVNARAAEAVAEGKAEIGITQISEILPVKGAELAGPLPPDIQQNTVFPAAISAASKEPAAAKALLKYLGSPAAVRLIKSKGLEPAG